MRSGRRNAPAVDGAVDIHADRPALLLGQLSQQAGRAGEQGGAAQQVDRQPEVGKGGATYSGAVQRQPAAQDLIMDPADRLEQPQVRAAEALLARRS